MLEAVSDVTYRQAVNVATAIAVQETQRADRERITALMKQVASPDTRMWKKERLLVMHWLDQARHALRGTARQALERVAAVFRKAEVRTAVKEQIRDKARPAIHDLLQSHASRTAVQQRQASASAKGRNAEYC